MTKNSATLFHKSAANQTAAPFDAKTFARTLAAWFEVSQRDLPWRRSENARDAYRVLVSEVMLQQTTVAAVIPFYQKFLARFPDVQSLAAASIEEVLPLWAGLGYYRRARLLHECAREIVAKHGGVFPRELARVLALPGIGRYTAGAVSSIAHEIAAPIVDANVARVFSRIFLVEGDLKSGAAQTQLWNRATQVVESAHENQISPAMINPALMELGALICTPRAPRCESCPVNTWCGAFATNRQNQFPFVPPRRAPIELHDVCVFAQIHSAQHIASTRNANESERHAENRFAAFDAETVRAAPKEKCDVTRTSRGENTKVRTKNGIASDAKNGIGAPRENVASTCNAFLEEKSGVKFSESAEGNVNSGDENARVLLRQRPHDADVWWRGMWELPRTTRQGGESEEAALRRVVQDELGFAPDDFSIGSQLRRIKHGVTHHAIVLDCYEVFLCEDAAPRAENAELFSWREIEELALPSSMRSLVKWLRARKPEVQNASGQRALF